MKILLKSKEKFFSMQVRKCNFLEKIIGLMFTRRENAKALLLFDFKKPHRLKIHSLFVFFDFLAIWLDSDGKIIEKRVVKPWNLLVLPKKKFSKLVEIPLNKRYSKFLKKLGFPSEIQNIYKLKNFL